MTNVPNAPHQDDAHSDDHWAQPVLHLETSNVPDDAINLNVDGRHVVGPLQGFGQMWQKTYRVRLSGLTVTPSEMIEVWKTNFPKFWPPRNHFYAPKTRLVPGEVVVLNLAGPGGLPLASGVMVIYADDESFTFMSPEGLMFAGWITFSGYTDEGATVAQIQVLIRANDPLYELGMRLGVVHRMEDANWRYTLRALAAHFGVKGEVSQQNTLVDPKVQWSQAKNIWYNAGIRSSFYLLAAPWRWMQRVVSP